MCVVVCACVVCSEQPQFVGAWTRGLGLQVTQVALRPVHSQKSDLPSCIENKRGKEQICRVYLFQLIGERPNGE